MPAKVEGQLEFIPPPVGTKVKIFDGETFDREKDAKRLTRQLDAVRDLMLDGQWRTLDEIGAAIGVKSSASVSARLRDLRKPQFGSFRVRRARDGNLFRYKVESVYVEVRYS